MAGGLDEAGGNTTECPGWVISGLACHGEAAYDRTRGLLRPQVRPPSHQTVSSSWDLPPFIQNNDCASPRRPNELALDRRRSGTDERQQIAMGHDP